MATVTVTPGWAGPLSAVSSDPIVLQVAGVGPQGASGVAPSGTGIVTVTSGVLGTPGPLTGDVTTTAGGLATTLATVNSNVGSFTNASITVNAKGQVTAASSGAVGGTWGSITGTLSSQTDLQNALDAKQTADADLTSWASVTRASGFDTFTATPSSANLATLLTDETGSGAAVFGTSPTITTPTLSGNVTVSSGNILSAVDGGNSIGGSATSRFYGRFFGLNDGNVGNGAGLFTWASGASGLRFESGAFSIGSSTVFGWSAGDVNNVARDCGFSRVAAKVVKMTDGTSGDGWIQNTSGRSRVTSDVTNTGTTLAAITGLSATVIAGRKYAGRMVLYADNTVAAEGIQMDFNGGSATWTSFRAAIVSNVQGATMGVTTSKAINTVMNATALNGTGNKIFVVEWAGVCNAAGTLIPRFAKDSTGGGGTLTIQANSNMPVEDYP